MKSFVWLPIACIAGVIIGAWGPREELRALKENAEAERKKPRNAAEGFQAFARMANIPEEAKRSRRRRPDAKPLFASTNRPPARTVAVTNAPSAPLAPSAPAATQAVETAVAATTNAPPRRQERMSPEDLRARIEEAQELWRTRVELARARWKEKLNIDAAMGEKFDAALDSMNEQLYDTMQTMAAMLAQQDKMTPELGLRMMGDATTIMAETYEKLGACVPADRRGEVSEMQVFEFIDPGVAEPLIPVQDKLDRFPMPGGRGPSQ